MPYGSATYKKPKPVAKTKKTSKKKTSKKKAKK